MDRQGLAAILVHHPLLDSHSDIKVPEVGSLIWFSHEQQSQLGKVLEVDPTGARPLSVRLFSPKSKGRRYVDSRFEPAVQPGTTDQPVIQRLTIQKSGSSGGESPVEERTAEPLGS